MARQNTENIVLDKNWKQVEFEICSNRGGSMIEVIRSDTQPSEEKRGYILHPQQGITRDEFPDGSNIYFRSTSLDGLLIVD